jgi:hypothetical protein
LSFDRSDASILAMRITRWLIVVLVVVFSRHLSVVAADGPVDGAPPDTGPAADAVHSRPPIGTDTLRGQRTASEVVIARVYHSSEVTSDALRAALDVAEAAFAEAAVGIIWKICGLGECNTAPAPTELIVRLLHSRGRRLGTGCLGEALIDTQRRIGVLATVYVDRVLHLARTLDIDRQILLGRTIAHEIGHLLLATNTHAVSGLMREFWSREELLGRRADDWALQPFEVALIRQRLALTRAVRPTA